MSLKAYRVIIGNGWGRICVFWADYTRSKARHAVAAGYSDIGSYSTPLAAYEDHRVYRTPECDHLATSLGELDYRTCATILGWPIDEDGQLVEEDY